jgi:capsule polysaccharide export protein KpsE/RkpR
MTEPAADRCAEMKAEIDSLQKDFEQTWLAISAGGGDPARYRVLRQELQDKRIAYNRECGSGLVEDSTLPRSVTADWRGG